MLIKFSKLCYILLVLYYGWFQIVFFQIPNMLVVLGAGMIGCIILHSLVTGTKIINGVTIELILWIVFVCTSLIFGMLVAVNHEFLFSSLMTFVEFLFLIFGITYISKCDGKIEFFINVFILFALICAITTMFWGVNYGQGRISMGLTNNPNSLGITMALGVCCILFKHNFKSLVWSIISFSAVILLIYVCLLTGSRKSFLSILAIITYWIAFVVFKDIKELRFIEKFKGIVSILVISLLGYYSLGSMFEDSVLLERLVLLFESGSDTRESMYGAAMDYFKQSPLVGIGFNNFRALSIFGTYSHSTYSEALACTGIIGCIFYFAPYIKLLLNCMKLIISKKTDSNLLKQSKIMLIVLGTLLFLGVGVIHFYEMTSSIVFGMVIAFFALHRKTNVKGT